jgi:hypothetical protein
VRDAFDALIGTGNDIIVAGTTSFDTDQSSLNGILQEWNSSRSFTERVDNLTGQLNHSYEHRLNGNVFLTLSTVQVAGVSDLVINNLLYLTL